MVASGPASTDGATLLTVTWKLSLPLVCPSSTLTVTA